MSNQSHRTSQFNRVIDTLPVPIYHVSKHKQTNASTIGHVLTLKNVPAGQQTPQGDAKINQLTVPRTTL